MKVVCLIVLFLSQLLGESAVVSLSSTNYEEVLNKGKVLVKYFSPNCGHCKALAPTYEQVAAEFNTKYGDKVTIAEVDCTANDGICKAAGVNGFPTIHFYKSGKTDFDEYSGDRSLENFQQFLSSRIGVFYKPPVAKTVLLTPENFDSIVYDPKLNVLVAFTAPWCGHCKNFKPQLEIAAQSFKDSDNVTFGNFDADANKDFAAKYDVHGFPTIKFFPAAKPNEAVVEESAKVGKLYKGNQLVEAYNDERSASGVINFMNSRAGTFRLAGGGIQEFAGLEAALVTPIKELTTLLTAGGNEQAVAAQKKVVLEAVVTNVKNEYISGQYTRYVNIIVEKGSAGVSYAKEENARLAGILEKTPMSDERTFQFTVRKNILGLFGN